MSQTPNTAIAVIGIDIGKNSFHVVGHDTRGAIVLRQKWSRGQVETRLANIPPCLVGMEACVGAHHLSRKLNSLGHDARLMPARYVRPYTADRATVRQKKTGRPVRFELSEQTRQAVDDYLRATGKRPGEFLFTGRRGPDRIMTTRHARLVSDWIGGAGLDPRQFGTHSLRRTKATLIYRRTGNLRAVQLLLGHTKIESTVRYLGIEVDDALAIAEQVDV